MPVQEWFYKVGDLALLGGKGVEDRKELRTKLQHDGDRTTWKPHRSCVAYTSALLYFRTVLAICRISLLERPRKPSRLHPVHAGELCLTALWQNVLPPINEIAAI